MTNPNHGYPPPPGYPGYANPTPTRPLQSQTNTLAIVAFVLSFFISIGGLICGIIAKRQIAQTGEGGGGLATAAIVLSSIFMVLQVVWIIVVIAFVSHAISTNPQPTFPQTPMVLAALGHLGR